MPVCSGRLRGQIGSGHVELIRTISAQGGERRVANFHIGRQDRLRIQAAPLDAVLVEPGSECTGPLVALDRLASK